MVTTKYEETVAALSTSGPDRTRVVRTIKNSIIGNKTKKELYLSLGVAPRLVEFLSDPASDLDLQIQTAVVLGSFAYGSDQQASEIVNAGAIPPLLRTLRASDYRLVEASARALKALLSNPNAPHQDIFQSDVLANLITLLKLPDVVAGAHKPVKDGIMLIRISEVAAIILGRIAVSGDDQLRILHAGALPLLVRLLDIRYSNYSKVQEAAVGALANLARENVEVSNAFVDCSTDDGQSATSQLFRLIRDAKPTMRLLVCSCISNLYRAGTLPAGYQEDVALVVLPTLIKLFSEPPGHAKDSDPGWIEAEERAPRIFADLVEHSEDLQKAAMEGDAISKLAALLLVNSSAEEASRNANGSPGAKGWSGFGKFGDGVGGGVTCSHADRIRENALRAIAAVCSLKEECRKQVIESKLLPHIVTSMSHPSTPVRAAACECTRSLSRSVKYLRTSLVDAGIAQPLYNLLSDPSEDVQITASATLCNIVLDFSPMKKKVLELGGVGRLVGLVGAMDARLRLNAVWCLKNLLYQADSEIKKTVMGELGWEGLQSLIDDPEVGIQEQALNLLRNLACGKEDDIDQVFKGLGEPRLMQILEKKLTYMGECDDVVLQTLYVIVNISTGSLAHKAAIIGSSGILGRILGFLSHPKSAVRVATIWCVINLTWTEDAGSQSRVNHLRQAGFEAALMGMIDDQNMDVKDRVKTALANFGQGGVVQSPGVGGPGVSGSGSNNDGGGSGGGGRLSRRVEGREVVCR
ncbi:hypothetical protein HDV00_000775 [Rhizophlyctis rosea]|nr:hypothetical protein HDV00_000775 [Rhizophlyctis rosea]